MKGFSERTAEGFQTRFLAEMGLARASNDGTVEVWEHPDVGYLMRYGTLDRIQCTLGAYTIPDDIEARCEGRFHYLHAGIVYQGAHQSKTDTHDETECAPAPFVCLESGRDARVRWSKGERVRGVELAIGMNYLRGALAPFLGLPLEQFDSLSAGVTYTQLPNDCITPLRELEHAFEHGGLTPALATSIASWFVSCLATALKRGAVQKGAESTAASFIVGKREVMLSPEELKRVERAHEIVLAEATDFPTSALLARRVKLGEQKLKAGFNLLYHQTIWDCGNEERMARAERLLREGDDRVADIALRMGYRSPSSFIEKFRAWSGSTPHQYRLKFRRSGGADRA